MYDAAGLVFDDNQNVEQPKRCCHDDTEVTSEDRYGMIANKGRPALIATGLSVWSFRHVLAYRTGRYANAQFEQQFIGNAFFASNWIA